MREIHEINDMEIKEIIEHVTYIIKRFESSSYITEEEKSLLKNIKSVKDKLAKNGSNRLLKNLDRFYNEMMQKYGNLPFEPSEIDEEQEDGFLEIENDEEIYDLDDELLPDEDDFPDEMFEDKKDVQDIDDEWADLPDEDDFPFVEDEEFEQKMRLEEEFAKKRYETLLRKIQEELDTIKAQDLDNSEVNQESFDEDFEFEDFDIDLEDELVSPSKYNNTIKKTIDNSDEQKADSDILNVQTSIDEFILAYKKYFEEKYGLSDVQSQKDAESIARVLYMQKEKGKEVSLQAFTFLDKDKIGEDTLTAIVPTRSSEITDFFEVRLWDKKERKVKNVCYAMRESGEIEEVTLDKNISLNAESRNLFEDLYNQTGRRPISIASELSEIESVLAAFEESESKIEGFDEDFDIGLQDELVNPSKSNYTAKRTIDNLDAQKADSDIPNVQTNIDEFIFAYKKYFEEKYGLSDVQSQKEAESIARVFYMQQEKGKEVSLQGFTFLDKDKIGEDTLTAIDPTHSSEITDFFEVRLWDKKGCKIRNVCYAMRESGEIEEVALDKGVCLRAKSRNLLEDLYNQTGKRPYSIASDLSEIDSVLSSFRESESKKELLESASSNVTSNDLLNAKERLARCKDVEKDNPEKISEGEVK